MTDSAAPAPASAPSTQASTPAAAPAPRETQSQYGIRDQDAAAKLDKLWDLGFGEKEPVAPEAPAPESAEPEVAAPDEPSADDAGVESAPSGEAPSEEPADWSDFDAYLTKSSIDRAKAQVTVKVDGKEQKVSLADALKAYELASAGHGRLAEAAKARETFNAERQQTLNMIQQRASQIEAIGNEVSQYFLAPYEQAVAAAAQAGDRGAYAAACYDRDQARNWFSQRMTGIAKEREQASLALQQQRQQELPAQRQALLSRRPEWADASRFQADSDAMRQYGKGLGFNEAELGSISDHRQLLVLDGAAQMAAAQQAASAALGRPVSAQDVIALVTQMSKLQASQPEVSKKVAVAPQMQSKPGTRAAPKDAKTAQYQNLKSEAKKAKYSDDATAALLNAMFK